MVHCAKTPSKTILTYYVHFVSLEIRNVDIFSFNECNYMYENRNLWKYFTIGLDASLFVCQSEEAAEDYVFSAVFGLIASIFFLCTSLFL